MLLKKALIISIIFLALIVVVYAHFENENIGSSVSMQTENELNEQNSMGGMGLFHEKIETLVKANDFEAFKELVEQYKMPCMMHEYNKENSGIEERAFGMHSRHGMMG